jgi:ABC-type lipoprotein release transport system permease subunit
MADGGGMPLKAYLVLIAYSAGMFAVCLLACIVPTRRALGVQPSEALRADG